MYSHTPTTNCPVLDEITGLYLPHTTPEPAFLIVDSRYAHATAPSRAEALRLQLQLGLRATTQVIQA